MSNKIVLWYLNHISTMEKERVNKVVQVKPDYSRDVSCWNIYSVGHTAWRGFLCAEEKSGISWMEGGMDGNRGEGDGQWGRNQGEENGGILTTCVLASSTSAAPTQKRNKQAEANLRSASITLLHESPELGAAEGVRHLQPQELQTSSGLTERGGAGKSAGITLGSDLRGKEMVSFQSVCKNTCQTTAGTWTLSFFVHFQFASVLTLNFAI